MYAQYLKYMYMYANYALYIVVSNSATICHRLINSLLLLAEIATRNNLSTVKRNLSQMRALV